jgi:hypothetical protein
VQNLKALLERLLENQIDFVLVGGFASVIHGATLVTQDLDICVAMTEEQVEKLRTALTDLHPILRMNPNVKTSFLDHPKDIKGLNNIYLKTDLGILDVMSQLPPIGDFEAIKKNCIEIPIYGHTCKVISLDDLIRIKQTMTRAKDQEALQQLLKIQRLTKK